jgi:hypothetical protein
MRFLTLFVALSVIVPAEAGAKDIARKSSAKPKASAARAIANKMPSRVLTFVCRAGEGEPENVVALTHMSIGLHDANTGAFSSSIYVRTEKGYLPRTITGTYTTVPNGFVFRTKWQGLTGEYTMIHVHPAEKTAFPGMSDKQICEVTGQLESP